MFLLAGGHRSYVLHASARHAHALWCRSVRLGVLRKPAVASSVAERPFVSLQRSASRAIGMSSSLSAGLWAEGIAVASGTAATQAGICRVVVFPSPAFSNSVAPPLVVKPHACTAVHRCLYSVYVHMGASARNFKLLDELEEAEKSSKSDRGADISLGSCSSAFGCSAARAIVLLPFPCCLLLPSL
jgi:hypothetical protein